MTDSARWCAVCCEWGDHHTDRHAREAVSCWSRVKHEQHHWERVLTGEPCTCPGWPVEGGPVGDSPTITSIRTTKR